MERGSACGSTCKCKSGKTCRFAHQCPVPKANGEPCAGFHTASRHKSAPHWPLQQDRDNSVSSQQLQDLALFKEPPVSVHTAPKAEVSYGITNPTGIFEQIASCSAWKFFLDIFAGATMPVSMALVSCPTGGPDSWS